MTESHGNGTKFLSWQQLFVVVLPAFIASNIVQIGITLWLLERHETRPHTGAASRAEFVEIKSDLRDIRREIVELRKEVLRKQNGN